MLLRGKKAYAALKCSRDGARGLPLGGTGGVHRPDTLERLHQSWQMDGQNSIEEPRGGPDTSVEDPGASDLDLWVAEAEAEVNGAVSVMSAESCYVQLLEDQRVQSSREFEGVAQELHAKDVKAAAVSAAVTCLYLFA